MCQSPQSRQLTQGTITYSSAKTKEYNILHRLEYPSQQEQFFSFLENNSEWMREIVAHHFNREPSGIIIASRTEWLHGSFNVCIPVTINQGPRVLFRLPLPYRVGETSRPGNADEKIRCEAGTYAWIEENCPNLPIPKLYGFAMSTGITFTRLENLPFMSHCIRRLLRWSRPLLGLPTLSHYARNEGRLPHKHQGMPGYLLIEYIEESTGSMLSKTWAVQKGNDELRTNLFHDLSRIFLSFARLPLDRIGSFIICDDECLRLANRPLSLGLQDLENEGIPIDIPRDYIYSSTDSYVVDTLAYHDSRLQCQPNAINDTHDFIYQTSTLAAMRTIFPLFFRRELRRGPFFFSLTDLHQSNIFVDEKWHITALVDLEWGCSLPAEMIQPPHWFVDSAVDRIDPIEFGDLRREFMEILAAEEAIMFPSGSKLSGIMNTAWDMGTSWYSLALTSPSGLFTLFDKMIQPIMTRHCPDNGSFYQVMTWYWHRHNVQILKRKLSDKEQYDRLLQHAFNGQ